MKGFLLIFVLFLFVLPVGAEEARDWEPYLLAIYENSDEAAVSMEEAYQHLLGLTQQPLDVNHATADELMQIPGLNVGQVDDIIDYRTKFGKLRSITELLLIPSITKSLYDYLTNFITVHEATKAPWYSKSELSKNAHFIGNSVALTASVPTYRRLGDDDGTYLGDPLAHSLRYTLSMGSYLRLNLSAGKSAGEPFASHGVTLYDTYSYNLTVRDLGIFRKIILGTYRGQFGMGLTFNNGFTLSKQAMLASVGRSVNVFSPYSGIADCTPLRGAALTVDVTPRLQLSTFLSHNYADATLNDDGTIATVLTSAYHRTAQDLMKRHNTSLFTLGAHLLYNLSPVHSRMRCSLGASYVRTSPDRPFNPVYNTDGTVPASKLYRLYQPTGDATWNAGIDYRLSYGPLHLSGEVATCDATPAAGTSQQPLATVNSLTLRALSTLTVSAVQRFYSYRYHAYLGSAFSESGSVTNESGTFLAMQWQCLRHFTLQAYTDYATFPWYRYHTLPDTRCWDHSLALTYVPSVTSPWTITARYRFKDKDNVRQSMRLLCTYAGERLQLRTQFEACLQHRDTTSNGFILSQSANYTLPKNRVLYINMVYFHTDDYASRLYAYERGMQYQLTNASFYGKGIHCSLLATAQLSRYLKTNLKLSHTHYYDRPTIASAARTIFSNHQTDIEVQAIIKIEK